MSRDEVDRPEWHSAVVRLARRAKARGLRLVGAGDGKYAADAEAGVSGARQKTRIFLSYSRKDSGFAVWLRDELERTGIEVFRDLDDTLPGEEWWKRLTALITQADTIVFLLSTNSVASKACSDEVGYATSLHKRIFPAVISDVNWAEVPEGLAKLHSVFFTDDSRRAESLDQLATALHTDLDWVRQHTTLLERAHHWETKKRARSELLSGQTLEEAEAWLLRQPKSAEPPTPLQHEFIKSSREAAGRRRKVVATFLSTALIVVTGLAIVAFWQRDIARNARADAEQKRDQALRSESVALGSQAGSVIERGKKELAFQLASKGLPRLWSKPDRPVAELPLREFFRAYTDIVSPGSKVSPSKPHGGHNLTAIRLSRDGSRLVTASWDATARAWHADTLQPLSTMGWYTGPADDNWPCRIVAAVDVTPDGALAVTGNYDGRIRTWRLSDGQLVRQIHVATNGAECSRASWGAPEPTIRAVRFDPSARTILTAAADGAIAVWRHDDGILVQRYNHSTRVNSAVFHPDDPNVVVLADANGLLRSFNIETRKTNYELKEGGRLLSLELSRSGRLLLATRADGSARVHEIDTGRQIARLSGHSHWVTAGAFGPDDAWIATGSDDGTVRLWDIETGATFATLVVGDQVTGLAIEPRSGTVLATTFNGNLYRWTDGTGLRQVSVGRAVSIARGRFNASPWQHEALVLDADSLAERDVVREGPKASDHPTCEMANDPDDPQGLGVGLQWYLLNKEEAFEVCAAASKREPDNGRYLHNLGRLLEHRGEYQRAAETFRSAVRKDSWISAVPLAGLIKAERVDGRPGEVARLLEEASNRRVGAASWRMAGMLWHGDDKGKAIQMAVSAAKEGIPQAHAWLARNLEETGRPEVLDAALFHYSVAAELFEARRQILEAQQEHENRSRIARRLSLANAAEWFEKAITWKIGEELPTIESKALDDSILFQVDPDLKRAPQVFNEPKVLDRTLDGCLKSSLSNFSRGECSKDASTEIATHFCRTRGYTKGVGEAVNTGKRQRSVKLVIERGPALALNYVWAADDGGGYIFSRITCE